MPVIRAFARRRLCGVEAVEEFAQDALLTMIEALREGRVEQPERIGGFVLGICRNLAFERARQRERRAALWQTYGAALHSVSVDAVEGEAVSLIGRYLLPRGGFDIGSSRARVDQLVAAGLRVQLIEPEPGPVSHLPKIDADAEIVVTHVPIDVRGYDSVDVVIEKADGTPLKTFRDIGWDPTDGSVYAVCEAPLARISMQQRHIRSRVIGTRAGETQTIAVFETIAP